MVDVLAHSVPDHNRLPHIDQIDARSRILAAGALALVTASVSSLPILVGCLALSFAMVWLARLSLGPTLRKMIAMDSFVIVMLILLPFTVPGTALFTIWGLPASSEGLLKAVQIGLKANAIILALMALVGTMESVTLGHALHHLKVPTTLVHLLLFTVRYIEVLNQERLKLRTAMKARGFQPTTSWHCYRSYGYLLGMMLVRALERSERILAAMKCRGFTGHIPLLHDFTYGPSDRSFALCFGACLLLLIAGQIIYVV